jgi:hypothetical protein
MVENPESLTLVTAEAVEGADDEANGRWLFVSMRF